MPWLSSKPDTYDCADALYQVTPDKTLSHPDSTFVTQPDEHEKKQSNNTLSGDESDSQAPLRRSAPLTLRSSYFDESKVDKAARRFSGHWSRMTTTPVKYLAAALQVDNVHILNTLQSIKISKSTLDGMKVIRQVDRKFVLVEADTSRGKLLLCIDQHAADERVRLEKMETDMFGRHGAQRRVETRRHEPPLVLRMNPNEREMLRYHEKMIKLWGFDFEVASSGLGALPYARERLGIEEEELVLLHDTPRVEKRFANGDDFREFIQILGSAGKRSIHSSIRPPVITRLLHSRACRSAIMFGDRLSIGQCRDLVEELKKCQLPFQCAHGRPSVVPLAEIQRSRPEN
ncbi:unnamed protein product [Phytophthora fragariaefolia]|uniref:Unnamed protein product n=1 Tax=Phytophthora fragariaefolia TaxID=1490495 RepID=A0A9W6TVM2_9STRA|nr:unnamed protein product [Phytophthora fragariaefolia]